MFKFSGNSAKRRDTLETDIKLIVNRALEICYELYKLDFGIPLHGGKRTAEEQNLLFLDGVSQLDGINKKSYHQSGMAVDTFAYYDGKAQWDEKSLFKISECMRIATEELFDDKYIYEWGGDWKSFKDCPHHQWKLNSKYENKITCDIKSWYS